MKQNFLPSKLQRPQNVFDILSPLFILPTFLGLRPYAIPGESRIVGKYSIVGLIFFVVAFALNAYFAYFFSGITIQTISDEGFFYTQSIIMLVSLLSYGFCLGYNVNSVILASTYFSFLERLRTLSMSERSLNIFRKVFRVSMILAVLIIVALCAVQIETYVRSYLTAKKSIALIDYLMFCAIVILVTAFIFPLQFLGLASYALYLAFGEHSDELKRCSKKDIALKLPSLHASYMDLTRIVEQLDSCFCSITLGAVAVSAIVLCLYFLNFKDFTNLSVVVILPWISVMTFSFVVLGIICTCLNDKSREILYVLHNTTPSQEIHFWLDAFHRKITDNSWGLTIGKLLLFERTACLGIISAMFTFVAFYAQFSESAPKQNNNDTLDWSRMYGRVQ